MLFRRKKTVKNGVSKMRRLIKNKAWLEKKLDELTKAASRLEDFYKFECSENFRGEQRARYNLRIYNRVVPRVNRRIAIVERLLGIS